MERRSGCPREMKFSEPPYRLSQLPSAYLDDTTVTMQWALGFARVQSAMARLQANWASPAAITLLKQRVVRQSPGRIQECWRFGDLSKPARILDETCQVNYAVFGRWSDPLDDFYGAMGEAQIKLAVSGMVIARGPVHARIEIDELGFYLRDSYDFNDGNSFFFRSRWDAGDLMGCSAVSGQTWMCLFQRPWWMRSLRSCKATNILCRTRISVDGAKGIKGAATSWCYPMCTGCDCHFLCNWSGELMVEL